MRKFCFLLSLLFILTPIFAWAATPTLSKDGQVNILLVPGHDEEIWGAQYGNTKEADMNLFLANGILKILKKDKRFKVYITQDNLGYTTEFADYFSKSDEIIKFKEDAKKEMKERVVKGDFVVKEGAPHNSANADMAIKLYGINKWANENKIDAVIHIHFNDYPRKNAWTKGKYKGFAVYMPEAQMANSKESIKLAQKIFTQLKKKYATSTYPKENGGFVEDQELIALGANGSLVSSVRSVLIEYGYIYRFGNSTVRHKAYKIMASLTAMGITNYFFAKK